MSDASALRRANRVKRIEWNNVSLVVDVAIILCLLAISRVLIHRDYARLHQGSLASLAHLMHEEIRGGSIFKLTNNDFIEAADFLASEAGTMEASSEITRRHARVELTTLATQFGGIVDGELRSCEYELSGI